MTFGRLTSIRLQDVLLAILFVGMAAIIPQHDPSEIALILLLGALQITESRFIPIDTTRGRVLWNLLKLATGYLLIGYTGGVNSPYYLVLLFPVISAAASLGVVGTVVFTVLACGAYVSFLLLVDWKVFDIHLEQIVELARRLLILATSGILVNTLAERLKQQSLRYKALAEELAEANRSVRRSERLAAVGQMMAGLAHELRNPLGTIKASAEMLQKNLSNENEIAREVAGYITSEVDRTNGLVGRFLDFARPLQLRRETGDLTHTIDSAIHAAQADAARHGVTLRREYPMEHPRFSFDGPLLESVFFNLILNAIQASNNGGEVATTLEVHGNNALVHVQDRGSGIEPERIETIFNPFVTSKAEGTGLGLAIVAKIVAEHSGTIQVESVAHQGSRFTVCLPMTEPA